MITVKTMAYFHHFLVPIKNMRRLEKISAESQNCINLRRTKNKISSPITTMVLPSSAKFNSTISVGCFRMIFIASRRIRYKLQAPMIKIMSLGKEAELMTSFETTLICDGIKKKRVRDRAKKRRAPTKLRLNFSFIKAVYLPF